MTKHFVKSIIIICLTISALNASDFESQLPKKLIEKFNVYKDAKINQNFEILYELRMPHFKFLFSYDKFLAYEKANRPIEDIKITKIKSKNEDKVEIIIGLVLKNKKNMVYYDQIWYLIDGEYYLQQDDAMHFRH